MLSDVSREEVSMLMGDFTFFLFVRWASFGGLGRIQVLFGDYCSFMDGSVQRGRLEQLL